MSSIKAISLALCLSVLPGLAQAIPEIQHWITEQGVRVYFVAAPELPMVDIRVVFDAGSARDGEQPGLAKLTNTLLDSGTAELSVDAVAEAMDSVGAQLGGGALRDMAWLSLRSLSAEEYLNPAVSVMSKLLAQPAFAPDSLERERNRILSVLQEQAQSPGSIAGQAFYQALYGSHPYANLPEGNEDSLKSITQKAIQAFHQRYYVAANAIVAIVGDLDRSAVEALAVKLTSGLSVGTAAEVLPPVPELTEAKLIQIPFPSSQSHVYIGQVGMSRTDPDYFSLYLGNHVLGGSGLVSLLSEKVREERGLSYSVYSYFSPMAQAGPFLMGLQTRNDQTEEAVALMLSTLQDYVKNGPDAEALEAARKNITGGFALGIDNNSKIARYLALLGFYGLPMDYLQSFNSKIEALSLEQVSDAFRRRIDPDRLLTVIVGGDG